MIPIVFAGTSDFSVQCLKFLLELNFQVKALISRPDKPHSRGLQQKGAPLRRFAEANQLPLFQPESFTGDFIRQTELLNCELALVCGYGRILPESFFKCFSKGAVNVHPSLLPRWRGAAPIERALMAGDTETGVSLQLMVKETDAGDLIGRRKFALTEEDTAKRAYQKSAAAVKDLLATELFAYIKGRIQLKPQEGEVTFAKKIKKEEALLYWERSAGELHNQIRALDLGPSAFCFFKGRRIKIFRSRQVFEDFSPAAPGTLIKSQSGELIVVCGKGALSLLEVQRAGGKRQKTAEFLRGFAVKPGQRLSSQAKSAQSA